MNGYIAYYKGKKFEVYAETLYEAKSIAVGDIEKLLRPRGTKWKYDVNIGLCETNCVSDGAGGWVTGDQVIHIAD